MNVQIWVKLFIGRIILEITETLKSFVQDENISSIVITVPAKFLNPQNDATKAAKLQVLTH